MLYWYRQINRISGKATCCSWEGPRKMFHDCLNSWKRDMYLSMKYIFDEVPSSCVKKLFPGVDWNGFNSRPWPK